MRTRSLCHIDLTDWRSTRRVTFTSASARGDWSIHGSTRTNSWSIHGPFMVHSWCNNLCPQHLLVVVKNVPLSIENVWIAVYQRWSISRWYQRQEEASADSQTVSFTTVRLSSSPDHATSNLLTLLTSRLSHAGTKCCGLAARLRPTHQVDQSA